ncbi:MAG TPA: hypothetical protein VKA15_00230 [Isosphaeraceae bacterium]|nr:hypothetical protein [Isosphaeraceae bacterium]
MIMGEISKRLHGKLKATASTVLLPRSSKGRIPSPQTPDIAQLIADGLDPVHAAYVLIQHIASVFAENVSQLPEMATFAKEVGKAEDEYLPSGPPMSPLTTSYFTSWAFFDHRIGKTTDTLASCLIDANDIIWMNPDQLDALRKMNESRMGIYEHRGWQENYVRLRELITDRDYLCHVASGYRGKAGEQWYVRLLPPLVPELATYHVAFTTPCILIDTTTKDWIDFLRRNMAGMKASSEADALHRLVKFGPAKNYWNEFVFRAYHHHQGDAVYLSGIPDLKSTLPHA